MIPAQFGCFKNFLNITMGAASTHSLNSAEFKSMSAVICTSTKSDRRALIDSMFLTNVGVHARYQG